MEGKMPNAGNKLVIEMAPWTNGDAIRAMTDEELAEWIVNDLIEPGYRSADVEYAYWLDWLREEAKDGKQNQPAP